MAPFTLYGGGGGGGGIALVLILYWTFFEEFHVPYVVFIVDWASDARPSFC